MPSNQSPSAPAIRLQNAAAILAAALLLSWPATFNRYPLLYPDTMGYLAGGPPVARAVFLHQFSSSYGIRSLVYGLGILLFHWNATVWPIVALNALLVAYTLWLVTRSMCPARLLLAYLVLITLLSIFTGLSWYVSIIMPDVLGPLLYLAIYLLVFAPQTLSRFERAFLAVLAYWAAASHPTHLFIASALCLLLTLLLLISKNTPRLRPIGSMVLLILLAAASQISLNVYLYGRLALNGESPPFLTARILADGPGRLYLEQHCAQLNWTLCNHLGHLPDNSSDFLWASGGIWNTASPKEKARIKQEEAPLVIATLRTHPGQQLFRSARSFVVQLCSFSLGDLKANPDVLPGFAQTSAASKATYLQSRQASGSLYLKFFSYLQFATVTLSLFFITLYLIRANLASNARTKTLTLWFATPISLGTVILPVIVLNALICGTASAIAQRYQCRVIWLIPFWAIFLVLDWLGYLPRPAAPDDLPR